MWPTSSTSLIYWVRKDKRPKTPKIQKHRSISDPSLNPNSPYLGRGKEDTLSADNDVSHNARYSRRSRSMDMSTMKSHLKQREENMAYPGTPLFDRSIIRNTKPSTKYLEITEARYIPNSHNSRSNSLRNRLLSSHACSSVESNESSTDDDRCVSTLRQPSRPIPLRNMKLPWNAGSFESNEGSTDDESNQNEESELSDANSENINKIITPSSMPEKSFLESHDHRSDSFIQRLKSRGRSYSLPVFHKLVNKRKGSKT